MFIYNINKKLGSAEISRTQPSPRGMTQSCHLYYRVRESSQWGGIEAAKPLFNYKE